MKVRLKNAFFVGGRLLLPGETVDLEDDEAARFEAAQHCVRIQQPAQKKAQRQTKKTEKSDG
ncbi:MAG: hypothetical protein J6I57_03485 [Desulfovibrio sp.]|nr:hypothetical protein [Desulfovibrio sp.]